MTPSKPVLPLLLLVLAHLVTAEASGTEPPEELACGNAHQPALATAVDVRSVAPPSFAASKAKPRPTGGCVTPDHLLLFEDASGILLDPERATTELTALMVAAANEVIATRGDQFDFIGFWTDVTPAARLGGAFYRSVRNQASGIGLPPFDNHAAFGLDGSRLQGMPMMYDFHFRNTSAADNALLHELTHRWLFFLNAPLPGGQVLAKGAHVDCPTDDQGGLHGQEWRRESPARVRGARRNLDTGERLGWLQLYLMGLASPEELADGASELRFMEAAKQPDGGCVTPYDGPIASFAVHDLVAAYGPRLPPAGEAQAEFRAAWVVIHEPGETPHRSRLARIARLLTNLSDDWDRATLGRSTLSSQLFPDCDCDGTPDAPGVPCGS